MQKTFLPLILPLAVVLGALALSASGCKSNPPPAKGNGKPVELVDCNYFWQNRNRHVCIKDMPKQDCEDLFFMVEFRRDRACVCDEPGRAKTRLQGTGYVQYDCQ